MSSVVVTGERNMPEQQAPPEQNNVQAVLKTRFGMDFDVTTDSSGTVAQARPVTYVKSRDKRTKAERFGTARVEDTYSPLTVYIDPEGRVTKEVYRDVYRSDYNKEVYRDVYRSDYNSKGWTQSVYEKRVVDYSAGTEVGYGERQMKSGRETVRKEYEIKGGQMKTYDIINQTDKNYKPRTEQQRELIREKGYRVMNTPEYAAASEYGQKRARMLAARKTPTGYSPEAIKAMKEAEKKARVSTLLTQQAALQESKKYYAETFTKVIGSKKRSERKERENRIATLLEKQEKAHKIKTQPLSEKYRTQLQAEIIASDSRINKEYSEMGRMGVTPSVPYKQENVKEVPALQPLPVRDEIKEFDEMPLRAAGYIVGEPIRVIGANVKDFGNWYTEKAFKYDQSGPSIAAIGAIIEGYGGATKKHPIKAAVSFVEGYVIGAGLRVVEAGGITLLNKASKFLPASVVEQTPKVVKGTTLTALGTVYAVDVGGRVVTSTEPYETFGEISATEIVPFGVGGYFGTSMGDRLLASYGKLRVSVASRFSENIEPSEIWSKEVLAGQKLARVSSTQETINLFEASRQYNPVERKITSRYDTKKLLQREWENVAQEDIKDLPVEVDSSIYGITVTPAKLAGDTAGVGSKAGQGLEDPGIYVSPPGEAMLWPLRLSSDLPVEYSFNPFAKTSIGISEPTAYRIRAAGVERLPAKVTQQPGFRPVAEYHLKTTGTGDFLITKRSQLGQGEIPSRQFAVETVEFNQKTGEVKFKKTSQSSIIRQGEFGTTEPEAVIRLGDKFVEVKTGSVTEKIFGYDQTSNPQGIPVAVRNIELVVTKEVQGGKPVQGIMSSKGFRPLTPEEQARVKPLSSLYSSEPSKASLYTIGSRINVVSKEYVTPSSSTLVYPSGSSAPRYSSIPSMRYSVTYSRPLERPIEEKTYISRRYSQPGSSTYSVPERTGYSIGGSSGGGSSGGGSSGGGSSGGGSSGGGSSDYPIVPPDTPRLPAFNKQGKRKPAYEVSVRQKGVFKKVATTETVEEAFKAGRVKVQATAAASFRVKAINQGENTVAAGRRLLSSKNFYESKKEPGVFIQKRERRISSPGEKKEITFKGIFASKVKSRRGIF